MDKGLDSSLLSFLVSFHVSLYNIISVVISILRVLHLPFYYIIVATVSGYSVIVVIVSEGEGGCIIWYQSSSSWRVTEAEGGCIIWYQCSSSHGLFRLGMDAKLEMLTKKMEEMKEGISKMTGSMYTIMNYLGGFKTWMETSQGSVDAMMNQVKGKGPTEHTTVANTMVSRGEAPMSGGGSTTTTEHSGEEMAVHRENKIL